MKKDIENAISIADYTIPEDVIRLILSYCEDSPQTLGRVAKVCTLWHRISKPKLEKLKHAMFDYLNEHVLNQNIVISPKFQQTLKFAVKIDRINAYPMLQQAFATCVRHADLGIDMGFEEIAAQDKDQIECMHMLLRKEYPFAYLFNYVFWDVLYNDADFNRLLAAMSILEALKIYVLQDQLLLELINSYHHHYIEEDTDFHIVDSILHCGDRTVDAWIEELMTELTRDVQPGNMFRYTTGRIRAMAKRTAQEFLQEIGIEMPNHHCCNLQ